jgi:hypothetical protein
MARAEKSVPPPGEVGTISRTGRVGNACAQTPLDTAMTHAAKAWNARLRRITSLSGIFR